MAKRSSKEADIDPRREDVLATSRRKRARHKPEPLQQLKDEQAGARSKLDSLPVNPGVMLEPKGEGYRLESIHSDNQLWNDQLHAAFGTRSFSLTATFLEELRRLVPDAWDEANERWKTDETELNAALAMVADVQPRNAREAALAVQMVAVHRMVMQLAKNATNGGHWPLPKETALMSKLARTYAEQLETLRKLRGETMATNQHIHVTKETHQHVHYHRGERENDGQPDATDRAGKSAQCSALPGEEAPGRVVRLPSRHG